MSRVVVRQAATIEQAKEAASKQVAPAVHKAGSDSDFWLKPRCMLHGCYVIYHFAGHGHTKVPTWGIIDLSSLGSSISLLAASALS